MTMLEFRAEMLRLTTQQAQLLCELTALEDIKIEPEQVRKNVATILSLLTETEDFLEELGKHTRPDSVNSIAD